MVASTFKKMPITEKVVVSRSLLKLSEHLLFGIEVTANLFFVVTFNNYCFLKN